MCVSGLHRCRVFRWPTLQVMWCNLPPLFWHWRCFSGHAPLREWPKCVFAPDWRPLGCHVKCNVKCVRDMCCRELLQMFGREGCVWFPIGYVFVCDVLRGSGSPVCVCKEMREWVRGMCLLMHLCLCLSEGFSLELHGSLLKDCSLCVHSESLALHLTLLTAQSRGKGSPSLRDTSNIHFSVPLFRYKIPHLSHWSHDSVCLSTCPFPRGSLGLPWGWGSWWQIWRIWGNVTMAEPESGEGVHGLFEALVVAAACLFLSHS